DGRQRSLTARRPEGASAARIGHARSAMRAFLFTTALGLLTLFAACGPAVRGPGAEDPRGAPPPSRPVAEFPAIARVEHAFTGEPPDLAPLLSRSNAVHVEEWIVESAAAPGDPVYEPGDDPFEA